MSRRFQTVIPKTVSMTEMFENLYADVPEQKCIACGKTGKPNGWDSLCNRVCYYTLRELFASFENDQVAQPDPRVIEYCKKYNTLTHSFNDEKVRMWMTRK